MTKKQTENLLIICVDLVSYFDSKPMLTEDEQSLLERLEENILQLKGK